MTKNNIDLALTAESLTETTPEPTYSGVRSFLRRRYSKSLEGVELAIVGVPLDLATTNRPGARMGPAAMRAASNIMAWERPYGLSFDPREVLAMVDYGDANFDFGRPMEMSSDIEKQLRHIVDAGTGVLALGGDHYIAYPAIKAAHARHGPLALVHFDAHSDTWEDEPGRAFDHGTMFRHAAEEGLVVPEHSVQIGLRTHNPDTMGFNIFDAPYVHREGVDAVIEHTRKIVGGRKCYFSFDIDCLDPAYAPGTGTPVSGGLSSAQALAIIRGLLGLDFVGGDVVEVSPTYDVGEATALAAAHIAYEFTALYAARPGGPAHELI